MTLESLRETYEESSRKTSEIVRQLCYAGIALIWIFRTGTGDNHIVDRQLHVPGVLLVAALALDLLQSVSATLIWGMFRRFKEIQFKLANIDPKEQDFAAYSWFNWPIIIFFLSKIVAVMSAYYHLLLFVMDKLKITIPHAMN